MIFCRLGKVINKAKLKAQDLKTYINNEIEERNKRCKMLASVDKKNVWKPSKQITCNVFTFLYS